MDVPVEQAPDPQEMPVSVLETMAAPYNPRKIEQTELENLARGLKLFGCVQPVVINQRTNHIVGGHQRVKAAKAAGMASKTSAAEPKPADSEVDVPAGFEKAARRSPICSVTS